MTDLILAPLSENKEKKIKAVLQSIILPKIDICTVEKLFLRFKPKGSFNYEENKAELNKGGIISFDTYFNSFSVEKWKNYTHVKTISINLNLKGVVNVKLLNIDYFSESATLVNQKIITADELVETNVFENLDIQPYKGLLYLEIEALENNSLVQGGYFYTNINIEKKSTVKFAVVICTYKREIYVNKNVTLIKNYLLNKLGIEENFEIFIIDNGRTLEGFEAPNIHLIPNRNAGGSGGYTRGIIEVLKRKDEFSHIILMDDDVVIEPGVFERLYNFIQVSNDNNICIGGSMLKLDSKYIQHENGAIWDTEVISLKHNIDLKTVSNVLFNEIEEHINYNGWWLFCFPTVTIDNLSLPYPFFIKMDDMELAIRLKQKIITLNGICVWHEALESKYSPSLNYYFRRNELIFCSLHSEQFSKINAVKYIIKHSFRDAFCYKYQSAELILTSASDFLKGPYYLGATNPEEKNKEVLSLGEKAVKDPKLPFIYDKYMESINQTESSMHRWLRLLTLNGHLLPDFLFHSDKKLNDKGYRIAPIHGYRPLNVFMSKKALYYNLRSQEGFVVRLARGEFFKIIMKGIVLSLVMFFKFPELRRLYRKTLPEVTNSSFWEKYLEIDKYSK